MNDSKPNKKTCESSSNALAVNYIDSVLKNGKSIELSEYKITIKKSSNKIKTKWILQTNIFKEKAVDKIIDCFQKQKIPYDLVKIIPFDNKFPEGITEYDGPVILYGTTTLLRNISKCNKYYPGMWFNKETFKPSFWGNKIGDKWLNNESKVLRLYEVIDNFKSNESLFIRPNDDFKSFTGQVFYRDDFELLYNTIKKENTNFNINTSTEVTISPVKKIISEWRFIIIDKIVVSSSRYKYHNRLHISGNIKDIEEGALQLAEDIANNNWQISEAYVLDICQVIDGFKVIEINCLNASGFYDCDIMNIIYSASELANKQWERKLSE